MNVKLLNIPIIENRDLINEGRLAYMDNADFLLGEIKRSYSIFNVRAGVTRGYHAHKRLRQLVYCSYGKIKLYMNDKNEITEFILDHPSKVVFMGPMVWHTMEWLVDDSVLVVLASENYDESDYIRNYDEFLRTLASEKNSL